MCTSYNILSTQQQQQQQQQQSDCTILVTVDLFLGPTCSQSPSSLSPPKSSLFSLALSCWSGPVRFFSSPPDYKKVQIIPQLALNLEDSCSDEGPTLETSSHNHFHGVKLIHINLKLIHYTFFMPQKPAKRVV